MAIDLAALLHEEMNFRIGIPDLHPPRAAVDEPTCQLLASHIAAKIGRKIDWDELLLNALCDSDGGNNPFYRDDSDTVALARELAETVRAAITS